MNMTSEDTVTETPDKFGSQPKMTPEQFELFQAKLAKLQKDPEFIRAMQNRQRAQAEFENLMAMDPERRSKLLFTIQCHRMTAWHESVERARKERERKEQTN
ncbi:MAG: hypothetical protein IKA48_01745 [Fibrobacter sp.]|nr:hypothetical protein [Fibrobacter sp.]